MPLRIIWLACALWAAMGPSWAADLAPARAFFQHSDIRDVRLSPSGRWVALATRAQSGRAMLAVVDLHDKSAAAVVAHYEASDIHSFEWVNDDRLVYNLVDLESASLGPCGDRAVLGSAHGDNGARRHPGECGRQDLDRSPAAEVVGAAAVDVAVIAKVRAATHLA